MRADKYSLEGVKRLYSFWGRLPYLYSMQDYVTFLGRPRHVRRSAVGALGIERGQKVLEVACGTGRNFQYLIDALGPEGLLVGFDYTQEMLDAARRLCERKGWKNVSLARGDAAELHLDEEDFDGVISVLGISAIPGWEKALHRCREKLRPDGVLVVCDARPFTGRLRCLNPLIEAAYSNLAAWDYTRDIPGKIQEIFGNVEVREFNLGTFFVARSVKRGS